MSTRFRSYETARTLFSFLEFVSWAVCIIGALTFLYGLTQLGSVSSDPFGRGTPPFIVYGTIFTGFYTGFSGLIGAAVVQFARANVDSAEYAQQGLQVMRENLEISRRTLEQTTPPQSFEAVAAKEDAKPRGGASFADAPEGKPAAKTTRPKTEAPSVGFHMHMGYKVEREGEFYAVEGRSFETAKLAEEHIDLVLLPKKLAKRKV